MVTRRSFIAMGVTAVAAGVASCSSGSGGRSGGKPADLPRWFAKYSPADEPDADPSKVRWPDFVVEAGGDVRELYEFQLTHGDLMRYMPCFCGCGQNAGHRNNRDCYIKQVNADGSVVFDSMAPT